MLVGISSYIYIYVYMKSSQILVTVTLLLVKQNTKMDPSNPNLPCVPEVIFFPRLRERSAAEPLQRGAERREKKVTSGHTYPEPHFRAVNRIRYPTNRFSPAARHSICLFLFLTFRLSMFVRGAEIREIAHTKWKKITSVRSSIDDFCWICNLSLLTYGYGKLNLFGLRGKALRSLTLR